MADPDVTAASPPPRGVGTTRVNVLRVVAVGDAKSASIVLADEPIELGRAGHVAGPLALSDTEVSRKHATFSRGDDGWVVVDHGSRNGTFVDGARLGASSAADASPAAASRPAAAESSQPPEPNPPPVAEAIHRARLQPGSVIRTGKTLLVYAEADVRADERLAAPPPGTRLVGESVPALRVHAEIALVAGHALPVLVLGETGVGKELVAEEIHRRSRRSGAFIPVNCAAIAPELAESELFGHVAGAFTGASKASDGLFVAADGGTLLLDEVGELPAELQPKLLRALASGEIRAVGSSTTRTVDVRVIAATLRDLDTAVREDRFRADLFNRLAGWRIDVPPLRARRDDVIAIANGFAARNSLALTADAAEALLLHDWPGNVRELERVIAAASVRAAAARGPAIDLAHLPATLVARLGDRATAGGEAVLSAAALLPAAAASNATPTREELCAVIEQMGGNMAKVADHYGKDRQQVYRWAKRFGIDLTTYRGS